MEQKTVSNLIFDKFAESIERDALFKGISEDLISMVRKTKSSKAEIQKLLEKKQNEDSGTGN